MDYKNQLVLKLEYEILRSTLKIHVPVHKILIRTEEIDYKNKTIMKHECKNKIVRYDTVS